jgi:hypothetical protein
LNAGKYRCPCNLCTSPFAGDAGKCCRRRIPCTLPSVCREGKRAYSSFTKRVTLQTLESSPCNAAQCACRRRAPACRRRRRPPRQTGKHPARVPQSAAFAAACPGSCSTSGLVRV